MTTTAFNTKIGEVEDNIPVSGLVTATVLNTIEEVQKGILNVCGLDKITDYNTTTSDIEANYFTTSGYNKFSSEILETKQKEKRLIDKSSNSNLVAISDSNTKLATLATKARLKQNRIKL